MSKQTPRSSATRSGSPERAAPRRGERGSPRGRATAHSLQGRVAVVAGATRGAGRGIARALGEAGAIVYCTGRSVTRKPSPYGRRETINETAAMVKAAGGVAIARRVDHSSEREVGALIRRIMRTHKRLDIVVDSVA